MNLRARILLLAAILSLGFVGWQWWLKPYEWKADPNAHAIIDFSRVTRDQSFYWLDLRLEITEPSAHDFGKPLVLVLADGSERKPDSLTREGSPGNPASDDPAQLATLDAISLKFWLESSEIVGPLRLRINDGILTIRDGSNLPPLGESESRIHKTKNW